MATANLPGTSPPHTCENCGKVLAAGSDTCGCGVKSPSWNFSRETVLLLSVGILFLFFTVTGFFSRFYHQTERSLARHWYSYGQTALAAGHSADAIQDFRTAMIYSRENGDTSGANNDYDLHLAEALAEEGRLDEARSYLLALEEQAPGNATVNLELARLAARQNDVTAASRYYNAAIFGAWDANPTERRRQTRIEYAKFLKDRGAVADAQAQLIAMAAALPPDPTLHVQAGNLLLDAGENDQAMVQFTQALRLDRAAPGALRGAGVAAYRQGNYKDAARYLVGANRENELAGSDREMLETASAVVSLDPFAEGLSVAERARLAAADFNVALERLKDCAKSKDIDLQNPSPAVPSPLQQLNAQATAELPHATEQQLVAHSDDVTALMNLVFQMEAAADQQCGAAPPGSNAALVLLGRSHSGVGQ
ncbi:MAG TPA: tetratricopeptide repeat protein [Candidatus Acidoferrales bacterium]|nr:tetratricopeptide repeat protein [Candidatus Acidoferrales bacterium]